MEPSFISRSQSHQRATESAPSRAAVLVNLAANNNAAERKWRRIHSDVLGALPKNTKILLYRPPFDLAACVRELHENDHISCFISAGGDGTLNRVLNAVMQSFHDRPHRPYLGAIGLGSRNDYHRPFKKTCLGIPLRIDLAAPVFSDVGRVQYMTESGEHLRYFITGASMGLKAEADHLFNLGDPIINALKPRFVNLAIIYTGIRSFLAHHSIEVEIGHDAIHQVTEMSNLSIIKVPEVSLGFEYDLRKDDGYLGFILCHAMTKLDLLMVLYDLSRRRFGKRPGRMAALVRTASLRARTWIPLATDGEIQFARSAVFSVVQNRVVFLG